MFLLIGAGVVFAAVFGGYAASGGHLFVLWQPFEVIIIVGAAVGAFIIGNPKAVLGRIGKGLGQAFKGSRYNKESYLELLSMMYQVFKLAKSKGMLALEQHVENPDDSSLFSQFPAFHGDHHVVTFLCDYLRMISLGTENPHEIEALIDEEIETHHNEQRQVSDAIQTMADGMPALGIVAAVLGVIHTMGSITEPPAVLGELIGGADITEELAATASGLEEVERAEVAGPGVDFWLTTEDLPLPGNRVTIDGDGDIHDRRCRPSGGHLPVRRRPGHLGSRPQLQGA